MINSEKEIVDAALELAKSEGWENVSIRKIAKKIGFSTMKIYSDFGSKERLLFDIQKIGFRLLKETYFSAVENVDDPKLKLESIFLSHVKFARTHSSHYELIFNHKFREYDIEAIENKQKACSMVAEVISEFGTIDSEITYIHYFSLLEGFVKISPELPNQSNEFINSMIKTISENFVSGLK